MADPTDSSGAGGRQRESTVMGNVDAAVNGTGKSDGPNGAQHPAAVAAKAKPSSMAPSGDSGPRVYGSPISTPVLGGGK